MRTAPMWGAATFVAVLPYLALGVFGTLAAHVFNWPMWALPAALGISFLFRMRNLALAGGAALGVAAAVGWAFS